MQNESCHTLLSLEKVDLCLTEQNTQDENFSKDYIKKQTVTDESVQRDKKRSTSPGGVYTIQQLPASDRPRERFIKQGAEGMSTPELIAIILGSGIKGKTVLQLSHEIIMFFGNLRRLSEATISEMCQIKGLGAVKAIQLKAALTIGMRASKQTIAPKYRIDTPLHAYHLIRDQLEHEKREIFIVILQDIKGFVITQEMISTGTLTNTLVHPREVFYPAIRHKAASLIVAHNHPSGNPTPSSQDYTLTNNLIHAGKLMGIPIHDHLIIGENSYISLRERGFDFN
jgi:DNA repair protein RadC